MCAGGRVFGCFHRPVPSPSSLPLSRLLLCVCLACKNKNTSSSPLSPRPRPRVLLCVVSPPFSPGPRGPGGRGGEGEGEWCGLGESPEWNRRNTSATKTTGRGNPSARDGRPSRRREVTHSSCPRIGSELSHVALNSGGDMVITNVVDV